MDSWTLDFVLFCFMRHGSQYDPDWPGTSHVAQTGFKLEILLPQPPECWDSYIIPLHLTMVANLETKLEDKKIKRVEDKEGGIRMALCCS